ncbi:MFS transporter [Paenibacillus sp. UNC451MF]|uniref:MFS transporter n=1 Tax=Paenibacillus sp. UNC451MF TaxID=1449063 RepID=UPI0005681366|nr:MFS transporter [Paenibacillus sp. UNC451MF]
MLNNRYVRTIILSRVFLQLGIWIRNFAILLYVTDMTNNDPLYVSLISVAEFAPIFIFAVIGGTFADRWQPKRTMIACDLLSAVSILAVLLVLIYGSWHALFFATLVSAILSQFSQPSAMKLFKQHVPAEQLQGVMAMFQSLMAVFMVIGPIIGTFVYQRYGIEVSISVMGVMFLGSALILMLLPRDPAKSEKSETASFIEDMKDGLRYVGGNRVLRTLGTTFTVMGLASGMIQPLTLFITIENLGQDKTFLQWLLMANGAAMLVGGGMVMGLSKKLKPHAILVTGLLISSIGTIGIGLSTNTVLTVIIQVLTGFFYPAIHIGINTMILKNSEEGYVGRVGGVLMPLFMGMMVVGMSFSGLLKDALSLLTVFIASGILFLVGASLLIPLFSRSTSESKEKAELG